MHYIWLEIDLNTTNKKVTEQIIDVIKFFTFKILSYVCFTFIHILSASVMSDWLNFNSKQYLWRAQRHRIPNSFTFTCEWLSSVRFTQMSQNHDNLFKSDIMIPSNFIIEGKTTRHHTQYPNTTRKFHRISKYNLSAMLLHATLQPVATTAPRRSK